MATSVLTPEAQERYNKVQQYLQDNPSMPVIKALKNLNISPTLYYDWRNKLAGKVKIKRRTSANKANSGRPPLQNPLETAQPRLETHVMPPAPQPKSQGRARMFIFQGTPEELARIMKEMA